jgi:hypothetical protein
MKSHKTIDSTIELLSKWYSKIVLNNALSYYDINRISENLILKILNLSYGLELIDLNNEKTNFPGIDLGDKTKSNTAYQVTSRLDSNKILDTLKTFVNPRYKLNKEYSSGVRLFILSFETPQIPKKKSIDAVFPDFDSENHILTFKDLIKRINYLMQEKPDVFSQIEALLKDEFEGPYERRMSNFFYINTTLKNELNLNDEITKIEKEIFPKYLIREYKNFSDVKTFLHPQPQPFLDIYYPISLETHEGQIKNGLDIFETSNRVTILGNAGMGKSTFLNKIFLECIDEYFAIPVLIELRKLNSYDGTLEKYISTKLFQNQLNLNDQILSTLLEDGHFLFLLDGFDELFYESSMDRIYEIDDFAKTHYKNYFAITSRPSTNVIGLTNFQNVEILSFTESQITEFIKKNVKHSQFRHRILTSIKQEVNLDLINYLSNPLLLSMFIRNYEFHPEIPIQKSSFYFNLFDTLYQRHGGENKLGFIHKKETGYIREDFELILQYFSLLTYFDGSYSFERQYIYDVFNKIKKSSNYKFDNTKLLNDLHIAINILILDSNEFTFPHRSLQEYFTVLRIKNISSEDIKEKIYKNNFELLFKNSKDNLFNLFSLCLELDKSSFYRYFLLPKLNGLLTILKNNVNSKTKSAQFFKLKFEAIIDKKGQLTLYPEIKIKFSIDKIFDLVSIDFDLTDGIKHALNKNMLEIFILSKLLVSKNKRERTFKAFKTTVHHINKKQKSTFRREYAYNNKLLVSFDIEDIIKDADFLNIIEASELTKIIQKLILNINNKILKINNELDSDRKLDENLSQFLS